MRWYPFLPFVPPLAVASIMMSTPFTMRAWCVVASDDIRSFSATVGTHWEESYEYVAPKKESLFVKGFDLSGPVNIEKKQMYINLARHFS